jgi:fatty acid desaturase
MAFWLGKLIGELYYGFMVVAAFYGFIGIIFHFCMHKWIKKVVGNYVIKQMLK